MKRDNARSRSRRRAEAGLDCAENPPPYVGGYFDNIHVELSRKLCSLAG
jgi:hypothetical protein